MCHRIPERELLIRESKNGQKHSHRGVYQKLAQNKEKNKQTNKQTKKFTSGYLPLYPTNLFHPDLNSRSESHV